MNAEPKLSRLILSSPWFLLIFLVVPIAVVASLTLHLGLPLIGPQLLLVNNLCFALLVACRLLWYLAGIRKGIRYGAGSRKPSKGFEVPFPGSRAREILAGAGFTFAPAGEYGEKHESGYLGTVLLYCGLLLLLGTGSFDNLNQFAGVLLDGVGPATKLSKAESYRELTAGPLATKLDSLPQLKVLSQILPDSTYPKGATEIALMPQHGAPQTTVLIPGVPFQFGAFEISMAKLAFEAEMVIKTKDSQVLFDSMVKLDPLVQKRGEFSFYGLFANPIVVGGVYYQPEKSLMMVVVTHNGKREIADLTFQVDQQVTSGNYVISCAKMGQWSEIHVVHRRHKALLFLGGLLALAGLILRLAVSPQRVWLEDTEGGCLVRAVGNEAKQLLKAD